MKIILAITGASGSIYAQLILEKIALLNNLIEECTVIFSNNGKDVWKYETGESPDFHSMKNIRVVENQSMFDAVASGSSMYRSMIIAPCSMGTIGKIASGTSDNLIIRAADVMLKEKKPLILVPRESPYNSIHLQNMLTLDRAGAYIMPASPFFYHRPQTINQLLNPYIERILDKAGIESTLFRWGTDNVK
jgi:flavin prenyltransferase